MQQKLSKIESLTRYIARLNGRIQTWETQLSSLSQTRVLLFVGAFICSGVLFFWQGATVWGLTFIPLFIPFIVYVVIYNRLFRAKERWQRWSDIKQQHLARMRLNWEGLPHPILDTPLEGAEHPFGFDLDLIGSRSFHQLVDTAVTQEGTRRLRQWLLTPLRSGNTINERQQLVKELESMPLFRDKLSLFGKGATHDGQKFPGAHLLSWLNHQEEGEKIVPWLLGLGGLAGLTAVLLIFSTGLPFQNAWLVSIGIYLLLYVRVINQYSQTLFQDATFLAEQLEILDGVFHYIESRPMDRAPALKRVCAPFHHPTDKPSDTIRSFKRVMIGIGLRQNPLLGLLVNMVVPWDLLFVYLLRGQQAVLRERLPEWLDVWYELEALGSLATYAYLNRGLVIYPKIIDEAEACFKVKALGHPLIVDEARVGNGFQFDDLGQVGIITGSNMAGKSSFLRTVGLNLAVAFAGGPVMASQFETSLFRLYSSIRVNDSLQDGFSFFYAEVRRLKQILEAYEAYKVENQRPLFFLIDEIFRGTNNRERLIGSRSYIQAVASGQAVGLVATHDLELVKLTNTNPLIKNYHFRDDVSDGKMVFDYKLRHGPSPTTNALKIMRLAGLPVDE